MTVAVIALALALAGGIVGIVALSNWLKSALYDSHMAASALTDEQRVATAYMTERDEALKELAARDALYLAAKARCAALEIERNRAYEQAANELADKVRNSGVADAVAVVNRLLGTSLAGVPKAAPAAASGVSGDGAPAVHPAAASDAGAARGPS